MHNLSTTNGSDQDYINCFLIDDKNINTFLAKISQFKKNYSPSIRSKLNAKKLKEVIDVNWNDAFGLDNEKKKIAIQTIVSTICTFIGNHDGNTKSTAFEILKQCGLARADKKTPVHIALKQGDLKSAARLIELYPVMLACQDQSKTYPLGQTFLWNKTTADIADIEKLLTTCTELKSKLQSLKENSPISALNQPEALLFNGRENINKSFGGLILEVMRFLYCNKNKMFSDPNPDTNTNTNTNTDKVKTITSNIKMLLDDGNFPLSWSQKEKNSTQEFTVFFYAIALYPSCPDFFEVFKNHIFSLITKKEPTLSENHNILFLFQTFIDAVPEILSFTSPSNSSDSSTLASSKKSENSKQENLEDSKTNQDSLIKLPPLASCLMKTLTDLKELFQQIQNLTLKVNIRHKLALLVHALAKVNQPRLLVLNLIKKIYEVTEKTEFSPQFDGENKELELDISPLGYAIENKNLELFNFLLDKEPTLCGQLQPKQSPLRLAAKQATQNTYIYLERLNKVSKEALITLCSDPKATILYLATILTKNNQTLENTVMTISQCLLQQFSTSIKFEAHYSNSKKNVFHVVAENGNVPLLEMLLKHNPTHAFCSTTDFPDNDESYENSPMALAAQQKNYDIVKLFLQANITEHTEVQNLSPDGRSLFNTYFILALLETVTALSLKLWQLKQPALSTASATNAANTTQEEEKSIKNLLIQLSKKYKLSNVEKIKIPGVSFMNMPSLSSDFLHYLADYGDPELFKLFNSANYDEKSSSELFKNKTPNELFKAAQLRDKLSTKKGREQQQTEINKTIQLEQLKVAQADKPKPEKLSNDEKYLYQVIDICLEYHQGPLGIRNITFLQQHVFESSDTSQTYMLQIGAQTLNALTELKRSNTHQSSSSSKAEKNENDKVTEMINNIRNVITEFMQQKKLTRAHALLRPLVGVIVYSDSSDQPLMKYG